MPAELFKTINVPVLILNGKADAANLKVDVLLKAIGTACTSVCEGDHNSAPYQPSFQQAVVRFLKEEWQQASKGDVPVN